MNKNNESLRIFGESCDQRQFYFFACGGINISFKILNLLDRELLGFENCRDKEDCVLRFNKLFCKIFFKFHQFWMGSELKGDVMNFNIAMKEFFLKNIYELIN